MYPCVNQTLKTVKINSMDNVWSNMTCIFYLAFHIQSGGTVLG